MEIRATLGPDEEKRNIEHPRKAGSSNTYSVSELETKVIVAHISLSSLVPGG